MKKTEAVPSAWIKIEQHNNQIDDLSSLQKYIDRYIERERANPSLREEKRRNGK